MPLTFVTGPVRSGKSRFAVALAVENTGAVKYVATAKRDESDPEWQARLAHHVSTRPAQWETVEISTWAERSVVEFFAAASDNDVLLVDSLGGWLDARIFEIVERIEGDYAALEAQLDDAARRFCDALSASAAHVIAVGEEVGWSIVPALASARLFRDVLGRMQQRLAANAGEAFLVVSGYAIDLRAAGRPVD